MKLFCYCYDSLKHPLLAGGGAFRDVYVHQLLAQKHDITFFHGYYKGASAFEENGLKFKFLGFGKNYYISRITYSIFATFHSLVNRADIYVISYSIYSPVLTFLFKPKRTVIQFYHFTGSNALRKYLVFGIFPVAFEQIALRFGRYYLTIAKNIADTITRQYGKLAIPGYTGIDEALFNPAVPSGSYVLSFGRIDIRMKGIDILFDVFEKVASQDPLIRLVIAGRGVEKDMQYVKNRIADSKYSNRMEFIYNPDNAKKRELLEQARFLMACSRFEGWNIVALEAAACCKPVIASNIPGLNEAVKDGNTGILCKAGDIELFAQSALKLWKNDELCQEMGKNAFEWVKQFQWNAIADIQENLYRQVHQAESK